MTIAVMYSEDPSSYQNSKRETNHMSRNPIDSAEFPNFKNTEGDIRDKIVDVTSKMKEKAGQMAGKMADTVDKTRDQAADGLDRAASTLHDKAEEVPGGPKAIHVAHTIADGMESAAEYLRDANFEDMKESVLDSCRKHPAETLIGALAIGFLVGRAIRR
jgi:hypothetical protein